MMKAAYLVKNGTAEESFEIREVPVPEPKKKEIRIKVEAFGLNYADVVARQGLYRECPPLPCVIGYEVVGIVERVGSEVSQELIGKRVVAFTRFGGYSEYAITSDFGYVVIGDLDAGKALSIATQYVTAYYMAMDHLNLHKGDRVLIHAGAGGVGTALIQMCKRKGCEVFATAGSPEKLEYMREQGADHVINYRETDYQDEVKKILKEERLDLSFNPIAGSTFKKDFELLGSGGRLVLFGGSERSGKKWGIFSTLNFVRKMGIVVPIGFMMRSKSVIGVNMLKIGDNRPNTLKRCLNEVAKLIIDQELNPHVGGTYPIDRLAEAHTFLEARKSIGKIIVTW